MKNLFREIKNALDQEATSINTGTGKNLNQYNSCGSTIVNMDGLTIETTPGMIRIYTNDEHYKIVIDGEIIRR